MIKVSIIGAGPGGLAVGLLLAARGHEVDIFEKDDRVGGRSQAVTLGRYHFDLGPTFLMQVDVLRAVFAAADLALEDYVKLIPVEPLYDLIFKDNVFRPSRYRDKTHTELERLFPGELDHYERFMRDEATRYNKIAPLMQRPFEHWYDYFKPDALKALPHIVPFRSVHGKLKRYFEDANLIHAMSFQSKYLGMSAWKAPGFFTMLSYLEHAYGLYHVQGGLNKINDALADAIRALGGRIHLNTPVAQLLTQKRTVTGLQLENGETYPADCVVANADFAYFAHNLLDETLKIPHAPRKLHTMRYAISTYMMYLGLDKRYDLPHHTFVFADNYAQSVKTMTEKNTLDTDITVYVHNPSLIDNTLAPPGHSALYILVPVPNNDSQINWESYKITFKATILKRIEEKLGIYDIEQHIIEEKIMTPLDWEKNHHVYKGAVFNLSHTFSQLFYFRPHNAYRSLKHLFLVGGGTHPGSGLASIYQSAIITANLIDPK